MKRKKIVITGGSGLIGRAVTERLLGVGHEVVWLSQSQTPLKASEKKRLSIIPWDPTGKTALDPDVLSARNGVSSVVHLAGARVDQRWTAQAKRAIRDSRVISTQVLTDAMAALPQEDRPAAFIAGSAIGWYSTGEEPFDENSPHGHGFLSDVVVDWEAAIARAAGLGLRVAIVRTGLVLSASHGMLGRLLPLYRWGLGSPIGSGQQWQSWIHLADLARLLVHLLEDAETHGVFNGVAPEGSAIRQEGLSESLAEALGKPHFLPRVPEFALRIVFGDMADTILASQQVIPRRTAATGFKWDFPDLASALRDLVTS